jgi:membrane-associated phospholipid phosphatase
LGIKLKDNQLLSRRKFPYFFILFFFCINETLAQKPLQLSSPGDYIVSGVLIPVNIGGSYLYRHKKPLTEQQISLLNAGSINGFDRSATLHYSISSAHTSDILLIGSIVGPSLLMLDKSMRDDAGVKAVIYFQTIGVTAAEISFVKGLIKRARPFVYNSDAPMNGKLKGDANASFFSGHTAMSAAGSYYTAAIISAVNGPRYDWVWFTAAVPPLLTGYFRYKAGKHFFTDILAGLVVGSVNGYLVTQLHKGSQ